jgi:hypothetical protein
MTNDRRRDGTGFNLILIFIATIVGFGLIVAVFGLWALWTAPTAVLKHITRIDTAVAPALTLLAVVAAVVGWYVVAWRNGVEARRTERDKQDHARRGTRRQVRTLLRDAIATITPLLSLNQSTQLEDVLRTYNRLIDRLNDRETAQALPDTEYDALDGFVSNFGRAIARAQERAANTQPPPPSVVEAQQKQRVRFLDERALFFLDRFTDALPDLALAVGLLGDGDMGAQVSTMMERSASSASALSARIFYGSSSERSEQQPP